MSAVNGKQPAVPPIRISVVIATRDRCDALRETLETMRLLDLRGLSVDWVVADNGSSDQTADVVQSFERHLPVRHVLVTQPGKNRALNHVLDHVDLGEWVMFTDDDVTPDPRWLQEAAAAVARWPECSVFGGRILPVFPEAVPPLWARDRELMVFAFCLHEHGSQDCEYPIRQYPFGGNLWCRRAVFQAGWRYNEQIGPRPTRRKMGSETALLVALRKAGYGMVFIPGSLVHHRIPASACRLRPLLARAYQYGRGRVRYAGPPNPRLWKQARVLWVARQFVRLGTAASAFLTCWLSTDPAKRARRGVRALSELGMGVESLTWWAEAKVADPTG
jgi:GT2 family glycosyltransferase